MMTITFVPLGVGDAFSARWYSSCLALEHAGRWILVDCPHPIRKMLREAAIGIDLDRIEGVALTHLHADHVSGLEGYGYFSHFALKRRARVLAHPSVALRLWDGCLAAGMEHLGIPGSDDAHALGLDDYFDVTSIEEDQTVSFGPFEIECRRTRHHVPTTAFRIRAGGATLGYSADTAFDPSLIEWLAESDLVIHETNYGIHTPYEKLAALPAELRAKMRLIHYPDDFDRAASAIEPLEQGRSYLSPACPPGAHSI
jgi:ribonuclease BN (tRNA processing enzyme)